MNRFGVRLAGAVALCLVSASCAIHYYDEKTGVEHLWGFGHMKMKVAAPDEGVQATVRGVETAGIGLGVGSEGYLIIGYEDRKSLLVVDEDTSLRFEWPSSDLFAVRVGSEFPKGIPEAEPETESELEPSNQE